MSHPRDIRNLSFALYACIVPTVGPLTFLLLAWSDDAELSASLVTTLLGAVAVGAAAGVVTWRSMYAGSSFSAMSRDAWRRGVWRWSRRLALRGFFAFAAALAAFLVLMLGLTHVAGSVENFAADAYDFVHANDPPGWVVTATDNATLEELGTELRLDIEPGDGNARGLRFELPEDAIAVFVKMGSSGGRFLARARFEGGGRDLDDWGIEMSRSASTETLVYDRRWPRFDASGPLLVVVTTSGLESTPAEAEAEPVRVRLTVRVVRQTVVATLAPGAERRDLIGPHTGWRRTYRVDVAEDGAVLRFDVDGDGADLDLYAFRGAADADLNEADAVASGGRSRQWLVVGDDRPLMKGDVVHVTVRWGTTPSEDRMFTLHVTRGSDPPPILRELPPLPQGSTPLARALASIVLVSSGTAFGSGTVVSEEGLIVTAHHVVAHLVGATAPHDRVDVSFTLDPARQPRELFRASLVFADRERDLAVLQIDRTLYGDPVPAGFRFPTCPLSLEPVSELGHPVHLVGYPASLSGRYRPVVAITSGQVVARPPAEHGNYLATDAQGAPGVSGGALLDANHRLIGVAVLSAYRAEPLAPIRSTPITGLPEEWLDRITAD